MLDEFPEALSKFKYMESVAGYTTDNQVCLEFRSEDAAFDFVAKYLTYSKATKIFRGEGNTYQGLNRYVATQYKLTDIMDDSEIFIPVGKEEWVIINCPHGNDVAECYNYFSRLKYDTLVIKKRAVASGKE